jgi:hypothetical protein
MRTPTRQAAKRKGIRKPAAKRRNNDDPNSNAVPFEVTAFAASVFGPPAISDAIEEEPPYDRSKATKVIKTKNH